MRVLVTRPEPAASRTAARLRALGHEAIVAPLLLVRAVAWGLPDTLPTAVALTSASAAALAGAQLARLTHLPVFAVGEATADAARAAGFTDIRAARGDASAVFALAARAGFVSMLHLAGADRSPAVVPLGLRVAVRTVYVADLADSLPADCGDLALLYSTRTADAFAALFEGERAELDVAALSHGVALALGAGWRSVAVAREPHEDALFAAAGLTCE